MAQRQVQNLQCGDLVSTPNGALVVQSVTPIDQGLYLVKYSGIPQPSTMLGNAKVVVLN